MKLAVLGGGQLGRMLGLAGIPLGVEFRFLDPSGTAGAAAVGELVLGALSDRTAVAAVARGCDAITYEWEGVPATALADVVATHEVAPGPRPLAISQDRVAEKSLCSDLGLGTAAWRTADTLGELVSAVRELGVPVIAKTRRGGYDGKGQATITVPDLAEAAWNALGAAGDLIVEETVAFRRELSVLACRGRDGASVVWPVPANRHAGGILRESRVPAADAATQAAAEAIARRMLDALDYVGVICIELFDTGEVLLVNEFAPRVHNSGHWTIEGATTSQFENHVRAVLGLPLGAAELRDGPVAMLNCVGRLPDLATILSIPGAHFHDYGKASRTGRKVGHVTVVAPDEETLEVRLAAARAAIDDDG
jgi:5-(carboxyamino)imidazole ribonucleotide synthase